MATYTDTIGFNRGTSTGGPIPHQGIRKLGVYEVTLNFTTITAARLAAGATALAAADILQVISLPAKTFVIAAGLDVTTAAGGTLTLDLGDGSDADGYIDGVDGNAVASYAPIKTLVEGTPNTILGYSLGKYYSAADTLDLVLVNAPAACVVRVWAIVANLA